ncbi:MAG TPA: hypothetical protein PLF13_08555 [candidate division Zixibacteria bacterium]|nr:hypothetical protein [candidate division Zixibacteria bacterium]
MVVLFALLLLLPIFTADLVGENPTEPERITIAIERVRAMAGRIVDTLDVTISASDEPLAGFDLKVGCDSRQVEILDVLPGEILDSCRWEFFDTRPRHHTGSEGAPLQIWRTIALAETIPDEIRPGCYGLDRVASLIRLVVSSEHVEYVPDTTVPIFFYWENCADNSVSSSSGNVLWLSIQVTDYFHQAMNQTDSLFPTRRGAPRSCIDPATPNKPIRRIDFHNGGVEFVTPVLEPVVPDSL